MPGGPAQIRVLGNNFSLRVQAELELGLQCSWAEPPKDVPTSATVPEWLGTDRHRRGGKASEGWGTITSQSRFSVS